MDKKKISIINNVIRLHGRNITSPALNELSDQTILWIVKSVKTRTFLPQEEQPII